MKPNFLNTNKPNSGAVAANRRSGSFRGRFQRRRPWTKPSVNVDNSAKPKPTNAATTTLQGILAMVALNDYPKDVMTEDQLNALQEEILNAVDGTKGSGVFPQFWDCKKDVGALLLRCNNTATVDWLKESVPHLTVVPDNALKVIESIPTAKEIPKIIVPSNYPLNFFTAEQLNKLYSDVLKEIDKIPEGSFVPQFLNCTKDAGALKLTCNNLPSAEWLKSTIPSLEGWTESQMSVLDPAEIPQRSTLVLTIPGPAEEPDHILERLERQNKGLKASEWNVVDQKKTGDGQVLYVCVDNTELPELKKIDYNPFLNFTKIKIKRLGKFRPREKKADNGTDKQEATEGDEDANETEKIESDPPKQS